MKIKHLLFAICVLSALLSNGTETLKNNTVIHSNYFLEFSFNTNFNFATPDTSLQLEEGDTIAEYTAGGDSVYVLYEDSTSDSSFSMAWEIPFPTEHMIIELTNHHLPVEEGLFGVNVTDMFQAGFANEDELPGIYGTNPSPWDYLSEMQPKILRFPSGAGGKFYQPLGSIRTNPDEPATVGFINGGYGINIDEVIRFYDVTGTDPNDAPDLYDPVGDPLFTSIAEDMADGECDECNTWMATAHTETFEDNFNKWASQPVVDPTGIAGPADMGTDLYINQFINLVQQIETENGYTVDVVVCLNISNETATESVRLIEYLVNSGINVVAVELGNEVYFEWGRDMMGFTDQVNPLDPISDVSPFIHYWDYINGHEYDFGTSGEDAGDGTYGDAEFDLTTTVPADVLADHDYITAINTAFPDIKIGLPGENFNQCEEEGWDTPFIIDDPEGEDQQFLPGGPGAEDCPCEYSEWNIDMETKFDKTIAVGESTGFKFDAIILHTYYVAGNAYALCTTNTNWQVAATEPTFVSGAPYPDQWTFAPIDPNIGELFEGIAGIPTDPDGGGAENQVGNFKEFTRDRIKFAFDQHAANLNFLDGDPGQTKEIWLTEYNILPKPRAITEEAAEDAEPFVNMVPNTFAHSVVLQNWALWNVRSYYDSDYKPGILTMATTQAFIGGNVIDFMTPSTRNDQVILDVPNPALTCTTATPAPVDDFFVRRATYFTAQLLNTIHTLDLNYEKTFIGMYSLNNNIAPTSFVQLDELGEPINLYVFYTNIKQTTQRYAIDPGDIHLSIEDAGGVTLGAGTVYALNPSQLYSTSGRSALFQEPINSDYSCSPGQPDLPHPFEITDTWTGLSGIGCPGGFTPPAGGVCVTVPATSAGYFVVPITPYLRKGERASNFRLYPNPADDFFVIEKTSTNTNVNDDFTMRIYSTFGTLVSEATVQSGEMVNTDMLPSGMYTIVVIDSNNNSTTLKFSKMQ
jgi:hypothetical protein